MAKSKHVRLFVNVARSRLDDAQFLHGERRDVAAVYLAGYVVECLLKALILSTVPLHEQKNLIGEFRGNAAHNFGWLRRKYYEQGGARYPSSIAEAFSAVEHWSTDLRYNPSERFRGKINAFMSSVVLIREWAMERL